MRTDDFRDTIDSDLLTRLHFIRKMGNIAAHDSRKISKDQAMLCLENLYIFNFCGNFEFFRMKKGKEVAN